MSKGLPIAPPVLEYLAGLTWQHDPGVELRLVDANKEPFEPEAAEADAFLFTVLTPQAPWVYRTADALRAMGKKVVLGGIHVSALPEEAKAHADALVLGEAEEVWPQLLRDIQRGSLQPLYRGRLLPLKGLPRPVTHLWGDKRYVYGYFQTSRGCPFRCSFCSVHRFYGGRVRLRPIDEVVAEVAQSRWRLFWGIDDNIWGISIERSIELYREMSIAVKGKWWFGSADLVSLEHPRADELLKYARRAGLTAVMVGWESENPLSLEEYRATGKQGRRRRDIIRRIRAAGIEVMLFVMVGGRQDSREDFEALYRLCEELKVAAHPVMTTPFPGTELYELYRPYLLRELDWDSYDGNHAVFEHPSMSPSEREEALVQLRARLFTLPKILRRMLQVSWRGFPMSHITSWMVQYPQGRAFREYARQRKREALAYN